MIAALGQNDQQVYVVPSLGPVVVRQGNPAGASRLAASSFDNELWMKIMAVRSCRPTAPAAAAEASGFLVFPNPALGRLACASPPSDWKPRCPSGRWLWGFAPRSGSMPAGACR